MKITILDDKGNVESETNAHSWVKQFLQIALGLWKQSHTGLVNIIPFNGIYNTSYSYWPGLSLCGLAGDDKKGIVVGVGSSAINPNDYMLNALCSNGYLANMMQYGSMSFIEPLVSGTNIVLQMTRQITNVSPGAITLTEVGLYVYGQIAYQTQGPVCIARDVLGSPVTVNVGVTKTIMYTITESNV